MTIFFTSDHHFGHKNVIQYCNRPFENVDEMGEELVKRWNSLVENNDTVYYLGDFSLSLEAVKFYLPKLNGKKILIAGNHDQCHKSHQKCRTENGYFKMMDKYFEYGFDSIYQHPVKIPAQLYSSSIFPFTDVDEYLMSHFPYNNMDDERFKELFPIDTGSWLLHGHVHNKWKVRDKMINVGVDVWDFYPVPLEEILKIIKEK